MFWRCGVAAAIVAAAAVSRQQPSKKPPLRPPARLAGALPPLARRFDGTLIPFGVPWKEVCELTELALRECFDDDPESTCFKWSEAFFRREKVVPLEAQQCASWTMDLVVLNRPGFRLLHRACPCVRNATWAKLRSTRDACAPHFVL